MEHKNFRVRWSSLIIVLYFSYDILYSISSRVIGNTSVATFFCEAILCLGTLLAISRNKKYLKLDAVVLILISLSCFLLTLILHPEYKQVMFDDENWNIFKMIFSIHGGVFAYLFFRIEDDPHNLYSDIKFSAFIIWICYTLKTINGVSFETVSAISGNLISRNYNQVYGFGFLFVAIIFTYTFFKEKKKKYAIFTLIVLSQILRYASRTAILAYGMYIILYLFFDEEGKYALQKKIIYAVCIAIAFLFITSDVFVNWLAEICARIGLSSKILDTFISGENELDGGRIWLWNSAIGYIKENPFGLGAYADRYYWGVYVHNIFLEILMSFGWILGGAFIIMLILMIFNMLKEKKNMWRSLFLCFFSMAIIRLLLSYSFWYDENFWFMLAVYVSYRKEKKKGLIKTL